MLPVVGPDGVVTTPWQRLVVRLISSSLQLRGYPTDIPVFDGRDGRPKWDAVSIAQVQSFLDFLFDDERRNAITLEEANYCRFYSVTSALEPILILSSFSPAPRSTIRGP